MLVSTCGQPIIARSSFERYLTGERMMAFLKAVKSPLESLMQQVLTCCCRRRPCSFSPMVYRWTCGGVGPKQRRRMI